MSVLIKTMEMPKNCGECQFCHTGYFKQWCCPTGREDFFCDAIPEWCPLEEPKTGEWVMLERVENVHDIYGVPTWGVNYMCDKCGFIHTAIQNHFSQYKYCPNCGARMYKGGDDE